MESSMIGMLASSKAGHDRRQIYVIIGEDDEYVYLADGRNRTVDRPKKKNRKLEVTLFASVSLADRKGIEAKAAALWKDLESVSFVE